MQVFPHCFEVANARKDVDSMDLHGKAIPSESKALEKLQVVTDNGWNVPLDEFHDFATLGILCFSTWQMLANRFQPLLPEDVVMLTPHTLHGKNIALPAKLLSTPKHKAVRPRLRLYPYRTQSKRWVLFCAEDTVSEPDRCFKLTTIAPDGLALTAFDWARNHLSRTLNAAHGEVLTFHSTGSSDADLFAHLACFLKNNAVCVDDAVLYSWRAATSHFGTELLQALTAHEDANLAYLACLCPTLLASMATLFDSLKDAFQLQAQAPTSTKVASGKPMQTWNASSSEIVRKLRETWSDSDIDARLRARGEDVDNMPPQRKSFDARSCSVNLPQIRLCHLSLPRHKVHALAHPLGQLKLLRRETQQRSPTPRER